MACSVGIDGRCTSCGQHVFSTAGCSCQNTRVSYYPVEVKFAGTACNLYLKPTPYKCPVCDGTGKVSRPPWIPGDVKEWTAGRAGEMYECKACAGTGIIWSKQP